MTSHADRRTMMVDTQVRPADVTKFPIIEALLKTPRELYLPADLSDTAYVGDNIEIAEGRVLLEARTMAKILDALAIAPTDMVLDIGCGWGYSAALIAHLAEVVVAVEEDAAMAAEAPGLLAEGGLDNVAVVEGCLLYTSPSPRDRG